MNPLRLGSRGSALAMWQAHWVAEQLTRLGHTVEVVTIATSGDQYSGPIGPTSGIGLFTKELQRALLDHRVDLAVHSLKDLPTEPVEGLVLAVVPERAPAADALLSRDGSKFRELPQGATIATSSVRRKAQLLFARSDLKIVPLRGNVDTRLRKLGEGQFQAMILAEAGLTRLGLAERITERLSLRVMLPAVGQGALGIETRADDAQTRAAVAGLDHPATHAAVRAERALLAGLRGGCLAPVAALARKEEHGLVLTARVLSADGAEMLEHSALGAPGAAEELGRRTADALLAQGAGRMIAESRE